MESGVEQGAAFVVYHDGKPVLDMWAGYADTQSLRRWRNDTTTMLFGAGQAITAFLVALMVDRYLQLLKFVNDYKIKILEVVELQIKFVVALMS